MCPFYLYSEFFGSVDTMWPLLRKFLDADVPISAPSRYSAEAFEHISGRQIPYVPFLGLHTNATYIPRHNEVMVFRTVLPYTSTFHIILNLLRKERKGDRGIIFMDKTISFQEMAHHLAVVLLPHVINALRLSDLFAMSVPLFVPSSPFIHKVVWPYNEPYCGRGAHEDTRQRAPWVPDTSYHPYDIFGFQESDEWLVDRFFLDREYWLQYSEWTEPWRAASLFHFSSIVDLYEQIQRTPLSTFEEASVSMRREQQLATTSALAWWKSVM